VDRTRYLVIVPRNAPETFAYLSESFRTLPDVELVVDRRDRAVPPVPKSDDRRGRARRVEAFGCTLVPRAPVPDPAVSLPPARVAPAAAPGRPVRTRPAVREA